MAHRIGGGPASRKPETCLLVARYHGPCLPPAVGEHGTESMFGAPGTISTYVKLWNRASPQIRQT